jgi:hypothetical protein
MTHEYEFRIKGRLSEELLATFAPLRAETAIPETVLVGPITDRAQLYGVVARLETLGAELLELRRLPGERSPAGTTAVE